MATIGSHTDYMTNTNPEQVQQIPDTRPTLFAAVDLVAELAAGVRPDQAAASTPCSEFTVELLLGHVIGALGRIETVGTGGSVTGYLPDVAVEPSDASQQIKLAAQSVRDAWSDDSSLTNIVTVPWGTVPGAAAAIVYANEMLVHGWDLATATGQQVEWPADGELEIVLGGMQMGLPTERDETVPFANPVDVGPDAPVITRLAAWSGRQVG